MDKVERKTQVIDASGQVLGRLATRVANLLNGKHRVDYTPNWDLGDFVVVKNAFKLILTGKKMSSKELLHHTTHPGGLKTRLVKALWTRAGGPAEVLKHAVAKMLPKNRLRKQKLIRLKIES